MTAPIAKLVDSIHSLSGKSKTATRLSLKLRNQLDCIIARHLCASSEPELNGEYELLSRLGKHCKVFVDVGANVGDWSAQLLDIADEARGYLYDPSKQCIARLNERFAQQNVVIREFAVSDEPGVAVFGEEDDCGQGSSLADSGMAHSRQVDVEITTLDNDFDGLDETIDFLKIDTEGHDCKVLKGAVKVLERTRFVQFEYNKHWAFMLDQLYLMRPGFLNLLASPCTSSGQAAFTACDTKFGGSIFATPISSLAEKKT